MSNKGKIKSGVSLQEFNRDRSISMNGRFILAFPPCFTEEQIAELRYLADNDNAAGQVFKNEQFDDKNKIRRSRIHWLDRTKDKWVYDATWKMAKKANEKYQFDIKPVTERIQISVYDASELGFYTWHPDADIANQTRKISISIPLSSPAEYVGGELQFMLGGADDPYTELQPKGGVITFPSYQLHRVTPVTKGRRYSLVCWVVGPNWR